MKVLWLQQNPDQTDWGTRFKAVPYEKENRRYAYKFLFWNIGEGLLLVGPNMPMDMCSTHAGLLEIFQELVPEEIPEKHITGAGNIRMGGVSSWESIGFKVETPEEFRLPILEALGFK